MVFDGSLSVIAGEYARVTMGMVKPVIRCSTCCMPDTRPGSVFDKAGRCLACVNYDSRGDGSKYAERGALLEQLVVEALDTKHSQYDVMIPVSGGKDSHFLAHVARTLSEKLQRRVSLKEQ